MMAVEVEVALQLELVTLQIAFCNFGILALSSNMGLGYNFDPFLYYYSGKGNMAHTFPSIAHIVLVFENFDGP